MEKLLNQIVSSSSNPEKLSLTVRGLLVGAIPMIMVIVRIFGLQGLDESLFTDFADAVAVVVQTSAILVSAVMVAYGFARKIYYNVKAIFKK